MTVAVSSTSYGAPAYEALRLAVSAAKAGDPLAPVTLIVPGERIGVAARRGLARGLTDDRPGIAALQVVTLRRLAEILSGEQLARSGRRPVTGPVLIGALRAVLAEQPGIFAPVAEHIGTARALAEAYRTLRSLSAPVRQALSDEDSVTADTLRICAEARQRIAPHSFDEVDLVAAATEVVSARGVPGAAVLFLPQDTESPEQELLAELARTTSLHIVLGLTGDDRADASPLALCRTLGVDAAAPTPPALADAVLHASDPDDEVRAVIRRVVAALADRPGHRVAVLYGSADPYARLLHEHFARAGVQVFGRAVRPAAETRFGRAILRLFSLPDHDFRRDEVLGFVTDAPVRHGGARAPDSAWERVSRAAGVVSGDDWDRLDAFARERRVQAEGGPEPDGWRARRARRDAEQAEALAAFVRTLRLELGRMAAAGTWRELIDAALRLWSDTLGGAATDRLPPEEQRAAESITRTLDAVARLDEVAAAPTLLFVRQLVELHLTDDLDRVGRIGAGVQVGPVSEGVGADVDLLFVVGAAEGMLPARAADDPLLPDRIRERVSGELPTRAQRMARQHRQLLAALAAAPVGGRTVSFPRGDLRLGGVRMPSRWLLPTLRAIARDDKLPATRWATIAGLAESPSYAGAVEGESCPATEQEWRQRGAVDGRASDDPTLLRAREVRAARSSAEFTVFDGNLEGETLPDPTVNGQVVSATALESWVHCPFGYFLRHLLRVTALEQPEQVVRISALNRGTLMHDILERLVRQAADEGWAPERGQSWPPQTGSALLAASHELFARAESAGVTGFPLLWQQDRAAIQEDLQSWVGHDDQRRANLGGASPLAAEWSFAAAHFPLGDGRTVRLRGKIDRIDRAADGGLVVTDYKTGKSDGYAALATDPCHRGQRLQLPVYAVAARAGFGSDATAVRAEYWFTSRRGGFTRIGYLVDDAVLDQARSAVRIAVDGLAHGMFLARPTSKVNVLYSCPACEATAFGEAGVQAAWERKRGAPQVAALRALLGEEAVQ